jgi:hypothetical protein
MTKDNYNKVANATHRLGEIFENHILDRIPVAKAYMLLIIKE